MPAYDEELFGPVASIITVRDEAEAVRVAVAVRLGHLSLSVVAVPQATTRGSETDPALPQAGNGVTWGGDVSSALSGGSTSEGTTVRLFQGPTDSKDLHF